MREDRRERPGQRQAPGPGPRDIEAALRRHGRRHDNACNAEESARDAPSQAAGTRSHERAVRIDPGRNEAAEALRRLRK